MSQAELERYTTRMYERVNELWSQHRTELFDGACGFSILNGPPVYAPKLIIIGENPGFGADDYEPHVEDTWPSKSYIDDASWPLAQKLRSIFGLLGGSAILSSATQTNFQFFKSSSIARLSRYRWNSLPRPLRKELA